MESEFSQYTGEEWWSDPRLKRVAVVVCTATCAPEGSAYRLPHQRLLDAITSGFVADSYRLGLEGTSYRSPTSWHTSPTDGKSVRCLHQSASRVHSLLPREVEADQEGQERQPTS